MQLKRRKTQDSQTTTTQPQTLVVTSRHIAIFFFIP
jgi:hypothetical protein